MFSDDKNQSNTNRPTDSNAKEKLSSGSEDRHSEQYKKIDKSSGSTSVPTNSVVEGAANGTLHGKIGDDAGTAEKDVAPCHDDDVFENGNVENNGGGTVDESNAGRANLKWKSSRSWDDGSGQGSTSTKSIGDADGGKKIEDVADGTVSTIEKRDIGDDTVENDTHNSSGSGSGSSAEGIKHTAAKQVHSHYHVRCILQLSQSLSCHLYFTVVTAIIMSLYFTVVILLRRWMQYLC